MSPRVLFLLSAYPAPAGDRDRTDAQHAAPRVRRPKSVNRRTHPTERTTCVTHDHIL